MLDNISKKTPLYDVHVDLGAKIVDFHNFLMPIQYESIVEEHHNVRKNAGIFDVSHMGEIVIEGKDATGLLNNIVTNDVSNLSDYGVLYTPICNHEGGIVDDILVYKYNPEKYMLVVNSSNIKKDFDWIKELNLDGANVSDLSDQFALLAVQGPESKRVIQQVFGDQSASLSRHQFTETTMNGKDMIVARTGYTGEDGFEIFNNQSDCEELWGLLLEKGKGMGLKPTGLGARDTLRLEAGLLLYGNDIDDTTTPLEAGIGWTVKFHKSDFVGKESLLKQRDSGLKRKLVSFKMLDRSIPRMNNEIINNDNNVGKVTSGSFSPTLGVGIGFGYIDINFAQVEKQLNIKIRDKLHPANIVNKSFIQTL